MDEELIRLLRSYNKQTSINVVKIRNCVAPLLGLAKYIYIIFIFISNIIFHLFISSSLARE